MVYVYPRFLYPDNGMMYQVLPYCSQLRALTVSPIGKHDVELI